jgi:hypothetical protein
MMGQAFDHRLHCVDSYIYGYRNAYSSIDGRSSNLGSHTCHVFIESLLKFAY